MAETRPDDAPITTRQLRRRIVWSLLLAAAVYLAVVFYGDFHDLKESLVSFRWAWMPWILGLTLVNYVGRLLKWLWYLRLIGVPISRRDGARVFGAGMLMVMTPGKIGELLKSYMVRNVSGTPMAVTAPIVLAERLTDGLAMIILAGVGLYAFGDRSTNVLAAGVLVGMMVFVLLVQYRPVALRLLSWAQQLPLIDRFAVSLADFYESSYILFRPRNVAIAVSIGVVSWSCEGMAYYLVLTGLGVPGGASVALKALFIFSISTVIGAVGATPGGMGWIEGGLVGLSRQLLDLTRATAAAAALLVRFATLWFGVAIGLLSVALWPDLLVAPVDDPSGRGQA
jgi:uncharacterized protein (TIRG00374 family)